jgi:hypothetical protein
VAAATTPGGAPTARATPASRSVSTFDRWKWVIITPAASLVILPAMPTKATRSTPAATARRRAMPVKSPTSTTHTSGSPGQAAKAWRSDRLPVARTTSRCPWAAATSICWTTDAR